MTYSAEVLADTPIGYWRLGDASGTTMVDSSGNARDGTYSNSPTLGVTGLLTGDSDKAVSFASASSQSASVADDNSLDALSAITVEAWIKPSTVSSTPMIVNRDSTASGRSFQFRLNAGKLEFLKLAGSAVTATSSSTLSTGTVYHVAAVYNGTDIRLYINGSLDGTPAAATGTMGTISRPLEIATRTATLFFNGVIDEVAVYGTGLSATRIAAHYTAGSANNAASGSGSLSLSGSGSVAAAAGATGALALSGSGSTKSPTTATGALSLSGSGTVGQPGSTGSGSLSLSGSGVTSQPASGAGALSLSGSADTSAAAAGSGSLSLSGSGVPAATAGGTGALSFSGTGTASLPAGGTGSLTLSGSGTVAALLSYSATVLGDSPDGYWHLDESSGSTAYDSATVPHDGVYNGVPNLGELAAIPDGTAVGFNTYLLSDMEVPHWAGLDVTTFSLELWAKVDNLSVPILSRLGGSLAPYGIWINPLGQAQVRIRTASGSHFMYDGTTSIVDILWHHVVVTRDSGGTLSIYVNGVLDAQFTGTPAPDTTTVYGLGVGYDGDTRAGFFQADEVAFYSTALTGTQVADHYRAASTLASTTGGSLTLTGSGTVLPQQSSGSLTLSGVMTVAARAGGTGYLELFGDGIAAAVIGTDTTNSLDGLSLVCGGTATVTRPTVTPLGLAVEYDKALPYPQPVMVNGRPT